MCHAMHVITYACFCFECECPHVCHGAEDTLQSRSPKAVTKKSRTADKTRPAFKLAESDPEESPSIAANRVLDCCILRVLLGKLAESGARGQCFHVAWLCRVLSSGNSLRRTHPEQSAGWWKHETKPSRNVCSAGGFAGLCRQQLVRHCASQGGLVCSAGSLEFSGNDG